MFFRRWGAAEMIGHDQNWQTLTDSRGLLYVANQHGLLEYDGQNWSRIGGTAAPIYGMAADSNGRIYVGGESTIGRIAPEPSGTLGIEWLTDRLPQHLQSFGAISHVHAIGDVLYFSSASHVIRWEGDRATRMYTATTRFGRSFVHRGQFYVYEQDVGLQMERNGELVEAPGGASFRTSPVLAILDTGRRTLLLTAQQGFTEWNATTGGQRPFPTGIDDDLRTVPLRTAQTFTLTDGQVLIAVLPSHGKPRILSADGTFLRSLGETLPLTPTESVRHIHMGHLGGLWLALGSGLARTLTPSTETWLGHAHGLGGSTLDMVRVDGQLYVGTTLGLFRLSPTPSAGRLNRVRQRELSGVAVRDLAALPAGGALMATDAGVYEMSGQRFTRVFELPLHQLVVSRHTRGVIYGRNDRTVYEFSRTDSGWTHRPLTENLDALRDLDEDPDGGVWVSTTDGRLHRLSPQTGAIRTFTQPEALALHGLPIALARLTDHLIAVTPSGRSLSIATRGEAVSFERLPLVEATVHELGTDPISVSSDGESTLVVSRGPRLRLLHLVGNVWTESTPLMLRNTPYAVASSFFDTEGRIWLGTTEGIIRYDPNDAPAVPTAFNAHIRDVHLGSTNVFGGAHWTLGPSFVQPAKSRIRVPFNDRDLQFTVSASSYPWTLRTQYQVQLQGHNDTWSPWSTSTTKSFAHLPAGSYTLRVQARSPLGTLSGIDELAFTILPPWYQTWWARSLFALAALLSIGGGFYTYHRIHQSALQTQRIRLRRLRRLAKRLHLTNEQLRRSETLQSDLLANTSHELRTPLTAMLGFSELLLDTPDEDSRMLAEGIHRGGIRLLNTVNGLLDMFKLRSNTFVLTPEETDAADEIRRTVETLRPLAESRSLYLAVVPQAFSAPARMDRNALHRVVQNLVDNAIKFTNEGGVVVSIDACDRALTLTVTDTGVGIDEDLISTLFLPFTQASSGHARTHEGTGLGLAIAHHLVTLMGGTIEVESTLGVGTQMTVRLPRIPTQTPLTPGTASALVTPSLADAHILGVSLDAADARTLRDCVEPSGTIYLESTPEEVLQHCSVLALDAVLIHAARTPNEADLIRRIRKVPGYSNISIVRVASESLATEALLAQGYTHQLDAPLPPVRIRECIESLLFFPLLAPPTAYPSHQLEGSSMFFSASPASPRLAPDAMPRDELATV